MLNKSIVLLFSVINENLDFVSYDVLGDVVCGGFANCNKI